MVELLELGDTIDRLPRDASGGEKRRLALAATLFHDPELMFLDEPTAGVDPILRSRFWSHFEELSDRQSTILVTTQYVGEAAYCELVAVLAGGRIAAFDDPEGLRQRAYGGELFDIVFATPPRREELADLARHAGASNTFWLGERAVRLTVSDAAKAGPLALEWARQRNLTVESAEPYHPPLRRRVRGAGQELGRVGAESGRGGRGCRLNTVSPQG